MWISSRVPMYSTLVLPRKKEEKKRERKEGEAEGKKEKKKSDVVPQMKVCTRAEVRMD